MIINMEIFLLLWMVLERLRPNTIIYMTQVACLLKKVTLAFSKYFLFRLILKFNALKSEDKSLIDRHSNAGYQLRLRFFADRIRLEPMIII